MIKQNQLEEIKKLINKGFDLELISFELDISMEDMKECKKQIENEKTRKKPKTTRTRKVSKMKQMGEKYNALFFKGNQEEVRLPKTLTQEELELIDSVTNTMEETINEMKKVPKSERRTGAKTVLSEAKKLKDYQLTLEQAEKLNTLIWSEELKGLSIRATDPLDIYLKNIKKMAVGKMIEAAECSYCQTEDPEELRKIGRKLTSEMKKIDQINISAVKRRIDGKASKNTTAKTMQRIKCDIPTSIAPVIEDLVNGTIDIKKANEVIDEEAKRMVDSKPKTRFSLTEEQQRKQLQIQIRTAIIENADKYHINNPEQAVLQVQELCDGSMDQALRTVIDNLINRQDFKTAKSVCKKFSVKDENGQIEKSMLNLRDRIRNAEIGNMVLKGINMNGTEDEEKAYFNLIEKGLKRGNIKLEAVSLGKSQDGLGTITLADIWPGEDQRVTAR